MTRRLVAIPMAAALLVALAACGLPRDTEGTTERIDGG